MYNSFNISMEFVLHDVKFKYEDGVMYRWYEFKTRPHQWRQIKIEFEKGYYYFRFIIKKPYKIRLHRLIYWLHNPHWDIFDSTMDNFVDHIDGNPSNNNIENLRVVSHQENQWNQTRAKGYRWYKQKNKWCAYITINKKMKYLGLFELEEDARQAYLDAKEIYHII
jgi:hypothetical protein